MRIAIYTISPSLFDLTHVFRGIGFAMSRKRLRSARYILVGKNLWRVVMRICTVIRRSDLIP